MSYKIKELEYHAKINDQVAQVSVTQSFVNTGSRQMEVSFIFPVPYDGAIDRMTFMVDGKEYDAKLLDAKEARKAYEEYVRRCQDPALLEWVGWGMFKTSVFPVPPGAERRVSQALRLTATALRALRNCQRSFSTRLRRASRSVSSGISVAHAANSSQPGPSSTSCPCFTASADEATTQRVQHM